ncbi:hypothetical protein L6452_19405 [Arctium lappa]|uniref:Uncharacterized protein n=1 Tax=Arctium lappa TaxID=4217 RepID=A0ACB9B9R9_ARCLA|nr:hypothetical protein L6452_19405 [Arctium lappa]
MDDNNEGGRRSNQIKIKRSSKVSNNADDTIDNDSVGEGEGTPEDITGKPKMVTTSSGVRVILLSVTHDAKRKNPVNDKSTKSPDKRKSSKSLVKNKRSKSTVRVTSPETHDGAVVVECTRKTRSKTRNTIVQRGSKKKKQGKGMHTKEWTQDQLNAVPGDVPDDENRTIDVFAERSTRSKVSSKAKLQEYIKIIESKLNSIMCQRLSAEQTLEKAIADYPTDPSLQSLNLALQRLFNTQDGDTGGSVHEKNNEHSFETPRRTKDSKQDQPTRITDNDPTPNEYVGLELVPGVPLETEAYWNNPTTIMEIDNSCIDYCKKRKIDRDAIPKFDLGISPERRLGKRETKPGEALRSPYVKRNVDIDMLETSSEKKICAWINAAVEPVCEPVFETTTGTVALRGTVESLCARKKIYSNTATMLKHDTSPEMKVKMFVDNILASVGGDAQVIAFKGVDLVFFPIIRDMHFFVVVFNFKRPSILIIDNIQQELETPTKFEEIPDLLFNALDEKEKTRLLQAAEANREARLASI